MYTFFQPNEVFVEDSTNSVEKERQLLYCISVPALTSWVKQYLVTDKHRQSESKPLHHQTKRTHPDDEMLCSTVSSPTTSAKRLCTNNQPVSSDSRCNMERCLPLPDSEATACLVKVRNVQSLRRICSSGVNWKWEWCCWHKFMLKFKTCQDSLSLDFASITLEWCVHWQVAKWSTYSWWWILFCSDPCSVPESCMKLNYGHFQVHYHLTSYFYFRTQLHIQHNSFQEQKLQIRDSKNC